MRIENSNPFLYGDDSTQVGETGISKVLWSTGTWKHWCLLEVQRNNIRSQYSHEIYDVHIGMLMLTCYVLLQYGIRFLDIISATIERVNRYSRWAAIVQTGVGGQVSTRETYEDWHVDVHVKKTGWKAGRASREMKATLADGAVDRFVILVYHEAG